MHVTVWAKGTTLLVVGYRQMLCLSGIELRLFSSNPADIYYWNIQDVDLM